MSRGKHNVTCLVCKKKGHDTSNCRLLKAVNKKTQPQNQKGRSQQNGKLVQGQVACNHCGKAGHSRAECFILNPSLKYQPKGKQAQQGGRKSKCTFCHRGNHSADECFKANPELMTQGRGNNKQPQVELRCSYCQMPDHNFERCYLLYPELRNPYHASPAPSDPWADLEEARRDHHDPSPRVMRRIKDAEMLAFDQAPPDVQRHAKWQRIQGWDPARQTYFTLPVYGAVVDRPVRYTDNPFNRARAQPAYEAFDTSGDLIMCSCGFPAGYECNLEHWVREVVDHDGLFRFSDRSEDAFGMIMSQGLVNPAATFEIY